MGAIEALEQKRPVYYFCHANLVDFAAPIMLNGRMIGSFIGGQVLSQAPNLEAMRRTAKEIGAIFLAMCAGLIAGMGYLGYGVLFALIMCLAGMLYSRLDLGGGKHTAAYKTVTVTVPEDLDYTGVFDDIFAFFAYSSSLIEHTIYFFSIYIFNLVM